MNRRPPARGPRPAPASPAPVERRKREVVTPEGVPLSFELAPVGDRAAAFALDCLLAFVIAFTLLFALAVVGLAVGEVALAAFLLLLFLLRSFYFTLFEGLADGRTPGKRALGLRVIDRGGGPLTGEAVFARNLTREIELFLPLIALLAPQALLPDLPIWGRVLALLWVVALTLLPFAGPDRLRAGDLLAGTLVVKVPRARLLDDLTTSLPPPVAGPLSFTPAQLDQYGIYELQVLEKLLREQVTDYQVLDAVARKVQAKIAWTGPRTEPEAFLSAFYAAQRQRLEQRMVLGERRERKREPPSPGRRP